MSSRIIERGTSVYGSRHFAATAQQFVAGSLGEKADVAEWHQQDRDVELVRWFEELRKCETVLDFGMPVPV
jgi:hypothetical protein